MSVCVCDILDVNRKPEPEVVFAAILAKNRNLCFSRSSVSVAMDHARSILDAIM